AQADLAIDHRERDGLQALAFARPLDAQPGIDLEIGTVAAAFEKGPIPAEEFPGSEIEPDSLVGTGIHIAEVAVLSRADNDDRKGPGLTGLGDPRQAERLRTAGLDAVGRADDENLGIAGRHLFIPCSSAHHSADSVRGPLSAG